MMLLNLTIDKSVKYVSKEDRPPSEHPLPTSTEIMNQTRERKVLPVLNFEKRRQKSLKT